MQKYISWSVAMIIILIQISCKQDDPVIPNEEELITTMKYTLTPSDGGDPFVFSFSDTDGEGGNPPTITTDNLPGDTQFSGSIVLLNESEDPVEDITVEVKEEGDEHQFFFQVSEADLEIGYGDQDDNGLPIGLVSSVKTGAAGQGELTITLRHNPNKSAPGVAEGNISNAGGETDIEVVFPIIIE